MTATKMYNKKNSLYDLQKLVFLLVLLMLSSCNSNQKEGSNTIDKSNLHHVDFLEMKVFLPDNYKKSSFEAYTEIIKNETDLDTLTNYELQRLNNLKQMDEGHELFIHDGDYLNTITFQSSPYFEFDKSAVSFYVNQLETMNFVEPRSRGIEFDRLESKFLKYGNSKIIKVKYLQSFGDKKRYLTQYIITYKLKTFGITITNLDGDDHKVILSNFKS
ncbi:hypothetical protein [Psychroserpens sp.]|uniref:hypothetical protein n=1 Tax=Psychroserpens sp. TaxID=2020870 RepID=UPI001AFE4F5F|nr:hypothetical protein [Psychroserpens sp.]MBO6606707.1 hypothetical protein [Psychroserpens sp.]MBO6631900.1 hypothetical protein [Psychroserpens sp.]MBO6653411.1 hypothetical protein [Psychroserpens sp.]MBO6680562.1 hypothetical protein [Psychroserpens sp.]MBO6750480.1 hypothetical protein [Psychroserpens sp.]